MRKRVSEESDFTAGQSPPCSRISMIGCSVPLQVIAHIAWGRRRDTYPSLGSRSMRLSAEYNGLVLHSSSCSIIQTKVGISSTSKTVPVQYSLNLNFLPTDRLATAFWLGFSSFSPALSACRSIPASKKPSIGQRQLSHQPAMGTS